VLLGERSQVRFLMMSLDFSTDLILPAHLPGGKGRPVLKTDNRTSICETIVWKMWGPRRLLTLWTSTVCYKDSFTFFAFFFLVKVTNQSSKKSTDWLADPEQAMLFTPWIMRYRKTHLNYLATTASTNLIGFEASLENLRVARLNSHQGSGSLRYTVPLF
jgi:hypothetical protein